MKYINIPQNILLQPILTLNWACLVWHLLLWKRGPKASKMIRGGPNLEFKLIPPNLLLRSILTYLTYINIFRIILTYFDLFDLIWQILTNFDLLDLFDLFWHILTYLTYLDLFWPNLTFFTFFDIFDLFDLFWPIWPILTYGTYFYTKLSMFGLPTSATEERAKGPKKGAKGPPVLY